MIEKNVQATVSVLAMTVLLMGVNHGGTGGRVPPEFGVRGTLIKLSPPPDFVMFLNANRQIFALHCSELYMLSLIHI